MIDPLDKLEEIIKYKFKNRGLLIIALTHPSYLNENKKLADSYQRLEFLGDAILEFVASDYIFKHFKQIREGRLTEIRAAMVRTESLASCASKLNLGDYIYISKGEQQNKGRENINILADVLEAVIAAIYLDSSTAAVFDFFMRFIRPELEDIIAFKLYIDNKTQLQEIIQAKHKTTPEYKLISQNKKDKELPFEIGVYLNKQCLAKGKGKNKRQAEQEAAKNALGKIENLWYHTNMTAKIRLMRMGKKKAPIYRIIVVDEQKSQKSSYLEKLGNYDPNLEKDKLTIDKDRLEFWQKRGAQLSKGLERIIK